MQEELKKLRQEIEELKNWKKSLETSHSIPLDIDQSFRERFADLGSTGSVVTVTGTGSYGTDNIVLSGESPYNFTQPDQPSGTVKVTINSVEYEFLIK